MILADENIPSTIIGALREKNIEIYSIYENNRGISDREIIEVSQNPPRIILTEDKDFGEWVFAHGVKSISVLFLRYRYVERFEITQILVNLIEQKGE
ncbi:MAG: toxin-antitoxin system, toxin component [Flavobacteriaceae bacterium]|nr:MAG: toxin-antitoxin system, toxin component [Flavobacteriaceae bacterium]